MRHLVSITVLALALGACGGSPASPSPAAAEQAEATSGAVAAAPTESAPAEAAAAPAESAPGQDEFVVHKSDTPRARDDATSSKIKPTRTEAALKFIVVDKDKGPIGGILISLTGADGKKYYTEETNMEGYAEVLVPVGQKYELVYLSLGRKDIAASVSVTDEPNQNVKLTLRYKRFTPPPSAQAASEPRFVLEGVTFDLGKATIRAESFPRLDAVVEYMTYKKSSRIEISGHTDNAGNAKTNKALSEKRAQACRDYLISKGIEGSRIQAIGYGDERPLAPNDSEQGRQQNRRIEATEL